MSTDLAASIVIRNKNNVWVNDNRVIACYCCQTIFSFFIRKHHCRNCGNVFCHDCSNYYIQIPDFIMDKPSPADYWNISYYITYLQSGIDRVCKQCYFNIHQKVSNYRKIIDIFENPPSMDEIRERTDLNADIKNHYFDHLRNIQYYLPNHLYSEMDKKILLVNASYFSKHSKYLVHLIKSIHWTNQCTTTVGSFVALFSTENNADNCLLISQIIEGYRNKSCSELYCTRTCGEHLSMDDCINIFYSCNDTLPEPLVQYLFDRMKHTSEQIILCHLPFLMTIIKNCHRPLTRKLIYQLTTQTIQLRYCTYWFCMSTLHKCTLTEKAAIDSFLNLWDPSFVCSLKEEYEFFNQLIDHLTNARVYLAKEFNKHKPIHLPYNPNIILTEVHLDSIIVKTSYTKPTLITFTAINQLTNDVFNLTLLLKQESVMTDVIALHLVSLCDIVLKESVDNQFNTITYPVMPITDRAGMIQIVEQSETIHSIINRGSTILQHIISNNGNQTINEVLFRYTFSLVSYTLHNYLIGLGDRHLENIMISKNGEIFHIDFGFILGTDSYPSSGLDIKLNAGMLDVIGNEHSYFYRCYLELCAKAIICLRKYFNIFFILLSTDSRFNSKQIADFILSRFQPRQPDKVIIEELMLIIKQSNNAYTDYIKDFLHYHSQERTLQNGLSRFLNIF